MCIKKVSIAVLTYNHEKFIEEALESCVSQTYPDFEICISDDCSTDKTVQIIKEFQSRHPGKIKLNVMPENMGRYSIAINLNMVLSMCKGDYIALLEGDDIMLPNRLNKQVEFLEKNNDCIAVSHNFITFDSNDGKIIDPLHYFPTMDQRTTKNLIKYGNQVHTPTVMFKNLGNGKLQGNTSLKKMIDYYFFIEMSLYGRIGHQNEILTKYRRHANSVSIDRKAMLDDHLLTLALVEMNYPQFLHEVTYHRLQKYLSQVLRGDFFYLKGIFRHSIFFFGYLLVNELHIRLRYRFNKRREESRKLNN